MNPLRLAFRQLARSWGFTAVAVVTLGLGIGAGSVIAGKLSAAKVEYGLLPLGALGLTAATMLFGPVIVRPLAPAPARDPSSWTRRTETSVLVLAVELGREPG